MIGIAYFPVAAGSPGPLDKNIPFGLSAKIFSAGVLHDTTVTLHFLILEMSEQTKKIMNQTKYGLKE